MSSSSQRTTRAGQGSGGGPAARVALVTGGAGFLGLHLCERLAAEGWTVHATSRSARGPTPGIRWWAADLADLEAARALLDAVKPELVFHLAGAVTGAQEASLVHATHHSHATSALNLLSLLAGRSVQRLVLTGTLLEPAGAVETAVPSSPYGAAKLVSALYARMFFRYFSAPVVVARPFVTYGPRQHPDKVLPYVIRSLLRGEAPRLGNGDWRADWVYVDDVIEGLLRAGTRPGLEGAEIDLGSGQLVPLRDLVLRIGGLLAAPDRIRFGELGDRRDAPERAADVATAKRLLGWEPCVSLEEGLRRLIAWHRAQP